MMVADAEYKDASEALSVYLDIEKGKKADLEAVSRSALAFAEAVREVAYVIDPSIDLRVELLSGTEGSLALSLLLRAKGFVKDRASTKNLKIVGFAGLMWFTTHGLEWVYEKILESLTQEEQTHGLSPAEMDEIAKKVAEIISKQIAAPQIQRVYRELQGDPAITGVGATRTPGHKPTHIVPRSQFPARAGTAHPVEETVSKRTATKRALLTLVSPVLLTGDRKWEFTGPSGRVFASMKDMTFLGNVIEGASEIRMVSGIQMDVDLETVEESKDGAWIIKDQSILKVYRVALPPAPPSLLFPTGPHTD